ncbi:hypothetical protein Lal_00034058 [Lupinus albus]|nr:hypothetical protein Lal_00034058 [Lupinus albus]
MCPSAQILQNYFSNTDQNMPQKVEVWPLGLPPLSASIGNEMVRNGKNSGSMSFNTKLIDQDRLQHTNLIHQRPHLIVNMTHPFRYFCTQLVAGISSLAYTQDLILFSIPSYWINDDKSACPQHVISSDHQDHRHMQVTLTHELVPTVKQLLITLANMELLKNKAILPEFRPPIFPNEPTVVSPLRLLLAPSFKLRDFLDLLILELLISRPS